MKKDEIKSIILEGFRNCNVPEGDIIEDDWIQTQIRDKLTAADDTEINLAIKELVAEKKVVKNGTGFSLIL